MYFFFKTENVTSPWVVQYSCQAVKGTKAFFVLFSFFPLGGIFSVAFSSLFLFLSIFLQYIQC